MKTTNALGSHGHIEHDTQLPAIVEQWLLQMMLQGAPCHKATLAKRLDMDQVSEVLGAELEKEPVDDFGDYKPQRVVSIMQRKLKALLSQHNPLPPVLQDNVARMGQAVGLNPVEQHVLAFIVLLKAYRVMNQCADRIKVSGLKDLTYTLSALLQEPESCVSKALAKTGRLSVSGLITLKFHMHHELADTIELLNAEQAFMLIEQPCEPMDWLKGLVQPGKPAELTWADYTHVDKPLQLLRSYLRKALDQKRVGVNVFVYGPPGTGKTQMARLLAQELQTQLYELCVADDDGDPIRADHRLKTMGVVNNILCNSQAMTLIDEVEEVFTDTSQFGVLSLLGGMARGGQHRQKAWINHQLENNALPTIWVSNSLRGMDPAFVRRFDMVLELPVPPLGQRTRIVQDLAGHILTPSHLKQFASSQNLAPAVLTRAIGVVDCLGTDWPMEQRSNALHMLVASTLKAQQHDDLIRNKPGLPELYNPQFVNTTVNLPELATQLAAVRSARICMYGPPGTGKTAFARWLAQQLDMPLHIKRASDLLSKWVGGSEKNIANAFEQAAADNAILLIDEVDSLLQKREGANQSWEVTQVNEMLTQMEDFEGVFIASTNLMNGLDPAALRRFDVKLNFMALRPEQAAELLASYCVQNHIEAPTPADATAVGQLKQLTPGDFAAVARRQRLVPLTSASSWVAALKEECMLKPHASSHLGFI